MQSRRQGQSEETVAKKKKSTILLDESMFCPKATKSYLRHAQYLGAIKSSKKDLPATPVRN